MVHILADLRYFVHIDLTFSVKSCYNLYGLLFVVAVKYQISADCKLLAFVTPLYTVRSIAHNAIILPLRLQVDKVKLSALHVIRCRCHTSL